MNPSLTSAILATLPPMPSMPLVKSDRLPDASLIAPPSVEKPPFKLSVTKNPLLNKSDASLPADHTALKPPVTKSIAPFTPFMAAIKGVPIPDNLIKAINFMNSANPAPTNDKNLNATIALAIFSRTFAIS